LTLWNWFQLVLVFWSWIPSFLPCFWHWVILRSVHIVILSKIIVVSCWFNWI
jgi:hypothetical protein